jgi:hypothetical protein
VARPTLRPSIAGFGYSGPPESTDCPSPEPFPAETGLSTPKSGKMSGLEKLLSFSPRLLTLSLLEMKALAWGGHAPHGALFSYCAGSFAAPAGHPPAALPLFGFELC